MKVRISSPKLLGSILFALVILFIMTTKADSKRPGLAFKQEFSPITPPEAGFCKILTVKDLSGALNKAKDGQIILNLYPIKSTASYEKKDFDLLYFFQDRMGKMISTNKKDIDKLKSGTTNYIQFLKQNKIQKSDIAFGYYIVLTQKLLANAGAIEICFSLPGGKLNCFTLPRKNTYQKSIYYNGDVPDGDSTGKCPPECRSQNLMRLDSIGKCPPDCRIPALLFQEIVKQIAAKVYKS